MAVKIQMAAVLTLNLESMPLHKDEVGFSAVVELGGGGSSISIDDIYQRRGIAI